MKSIRAFELALDQARADVGLTAGKIDGGRRRLNKLMREFEERCNELIVHVTGLKAAMTQECEIISEELDAASTDLQDMADKPEPGTPPVIEHAADEQVEGKVKAIGTRRER